MKSSSPHVGEHHGPHCPVLTGEAQAIAGNWVLFGENLNWQTQNDHDQLRFSGEPILPLSPHEGLQNRAEGAGTCPWPVGSLDTACAEISF